MSESDKQKGSKIKIRYVAIAIIFIGCISAITSYMTAKTFAPALTEFTLTPVDIVKTTTPTTLPAPTLYISPTVADAPTQLQLPIVESNLLRNGSFEDGLVGWNYSKQLTQYETTGISGKAFCSNQYVQLASGYPETVQNSLIGFSQEFPPLDPTQTYFFSAWVKLNKAIDVFARIDFVDGSEIKGMMAIELSPFSRINHENNGKTTNGWVFIHTEIPAHYVKSKVIVIGFWQGLILDPPQTVDSTFCVDDVVFGRIIK
jgi:hypothetical protein